MNFFNRPLFIVAHSLKYPNFYSTYKQMMKNQWKSLAKLKDEQNKQLKIMIKYCDDYVPYYHNLFKNIGIRPDSIKSVEDLDSIPVLTKEIVKKNWESLKPIKLNRIRFQEQATGGSMGTPMKYRISKEDRFLGGALLYRGWGYGGYNIGDRMVMLAGSSLDTDTKNGLEKKIHEYSRNIRKLSSFDMGEKEMRSYARLIENWKPLYIRGYPSSIFYFCEWLEEKNIPLPTPRAVFTTSEKIYPPIRKKISNYFNAPVFDGYGLNDGGVSAYECGEHRGLHIDTERSVMELVDEFGQVIESGEGTILATSLYNFAMPFLRYNTGDIATLSAEPCTCGRAYLLLTEIVGRSVDVLITPEGTKVHGWFFLYIFWEHGEGIKEYQIVQESIDDIQIQIVKDDGFNDKKLEIISRIISSKSPKWKITFRFVDEIKRTRAGKFKFIINKIGI